MWHELGVFEVLSPVSAALPCHGSCPNGTEVVPKPVRNVLVVGPRPCFPAGMYLGSKQRCSLHVNQTFVFLPFSVLA